MLQVLLSIFWLIVSKENQRGQGVLELHGHDPLIKATFSDDHDFSSSHEESQPSLLNSLYSFFHDELNLSTLGNSQIIMIALDDHEDDLTPFDSLLFWCSVLFCHLCFLLFVQIRKWKHWERETANDQDLSNGVLLADGLT